MGRSKYTKEILQEAVEKSVSFAGVLRHLEIRPGGGTQAHIANMIRKFEIDHSHFTGKSSTKGISSSNRLSAQEILIRLPEGSSRAKAFLLRRALEESGVEPKCNRCGLERMWNGQYLQLQVNHIDGEWRNCLIDNLEFICPNCHSQDPNTNTPHIYRNK